MTKQPSPLSRIARAVGILLISLVVVFLLAIGLLQVPAVQQYAAEKATQFLEDKLETTVTLERIRLRPLRSLRLQGVYVENPQQDTLIYARSLDAGFSLRGLWRKTIRITEVSLYDATFRGTEENMQFLASAFASDTPAPPKPPPANPWSILVRPGQVNLHRVRFLFSQPSLLLETNIGNLQTEITDANLTDLSFQLERLQMQHSRVHLVQKPGANRSAPDTTGSTEKSPGTSLKVITRQLDLDDITYTMEAPGLDLTATTGQTSASEINYTLQGSDMRFTVGGFAMSGGGFSYDRPIPRAARGFDPNHMGLRDIGIQVQDITYDNLHINAKLDQLSAREQSGAAVEEVSGTIYYQLDSIDVRQLALRTPRSQLTMPRGTLTLPFLTSDATIGEMGMNAVTEGWIHPGDIALFAPQLLDQPWFAGNQKDPLQVSARVSGKMNQLSIPRATLRGWDTRLVTNGRIAGLPNIDSTAFDLNIASLETTDSGLQRMLPDSTLPAGVQLPQNAQLSGTVIGPVNDLNLQLQLRTSRPEMPLATYLRSSLRLQNVLGDTTLAFDLQLDSLYTTRPDLLAWLPTGVLPTGTTLPAQVLLTGRLSGSTQQLYPDLTLRLQDAAGRGELNLQGSVADFQSVEDLSAEARVNITRFSGPLLERFLPQGSLPDSLRLPGIRQGTILFGGSLRAFNLNSNLNTEVGNIILEGERQDSAYQLALDVPSIDLNPVLPGAWTQVANSDSIVPLSLQAQVRGAGFAFLENTRFTGSLRLRPDSLYAWDSGLQVDLTGSPGQVIADLQVAEREVDLVGQMQYRDDGRKARATANLDIDEINFSGLGLSRRPFYLTTNLTGTADGLSLTSMDAQVGIRNTGVRYDSVYEELDSLVLRAHLDSFQNRIDLIADFMAAELSGSFDFQQINRKVRTHLLDHLRPEQLELRTSRDTARAELAYELQIFETNLLTSGIIPGLRGLKPMYAAGSFNEAQQTFSTQVRLPYLRYRSYQIDSLTTRIESTDDNLSYLLDWSNLNLYQQFDVANLTLQGQIVNGVLRNKLRQVDQEKQERFRINTYLEQTDSSLIVTFDRNILLNYNPWKLSPRNKIVLQENAVMVQDWDLTFEDQSLTITSSQAFENDLTLNITKFRLSNLSNLVDYNGNVLSGLLSGNIFLRDWQESYFVETVLFADDLNVLDAALGNLNLRLRGGQNEDFTLSSLLQGSKNDLKINGTYRQTDNQKLDFQATINALDLSTLRPLAQGNLSRLDGNGQGELTVQGTVANPDLSGTLTLTDAYVQLSITQVTYHIPEETVELLPRGIRLRDWQLTDPRGEQATVDGWLLTQNYQSFIFDLRLNGQNLQVLDTDRSHSDLYYGTLFTDAEVQLTGPLFDPTIRARVKNRANSTVTYLYGLNTGSSIDQGKDVVEFVNLEYILFRDSSRRSERAKAPRGVAYDLQLNLQVTEELDVKVVMDELTGDAFTGSGNGDLALRLNSAGDMEMTGRLDLIDGKYRFTYSEVVKRTFEIGEGSYVQFTGNPYDPELNLNTLYRTRASTLPLLALGNNDLSTEEQDELTQRIPFVVAINVGGSLKEIDLSTDITAEGAPGTMVNSALDQLRSDPSQLNTQAFSLILFNGFLAQGTASNSGLGDVNIQSGLNDFITSQLNNLANEYISFVELNFGIESDETSNGLFEDTNFRVSLRKNFLDDRLQISVDGVASTRDDPNSDSQAFLDNLSVTYLLTEDGVLKIKVFNQREEDDFTGGNTMRLGGALVFSKDFDRIQLFTKPKRK